MRTLWPIVCCTLLLACTSDNRTEDGGLTERDTGVFEDAGPAWTAGTDTSVAVFESTHVFFGSENRRQVDVTVTLPEAGSVYERVSLDFNLGCPNGACDWWDRVGWMGIVQNAGTDEERVFEIHRYITSYRVATAWQVDVTDFQPLLHGEVTFRVFIDTWVGPGHANGNGWLVDATLQYVGGMPDRIPVAVEPVFNVERVAYGHADTPLDPVRSQSFNLRAPQGASRASILSFITGHGQGNAGNCAEFCPKNHTVTLNDEARTHRLWRDDCALTAPEQFGNRTSPRAGWCPGTEANAWREDFEGSFNPGDTVTVTYGIEAYVNTCSPDNCTPSTCAFDENCEYNDSYHTAPNYLVSMAVVFYE